MRTAKPISASRIFYVDSSILLYYKNDMPKIERDAIDRMERLFVELRNGLLETAQEYAKSEQPDWGRAEHFFSASRRVDALCRSILGTDSTSEMDEEERTPAENPNLTRSERQPVSSRRKSRNDYPKWSVRSDALIKLGLSRNRKTEYEHVVPRKEFDAIIAQLAANAGRRHFTAEEVIDQVSAPSYQVYIVLSLLKKHGLLTVPRRGMYAFGRTKNFVNEAKSIWQALEDNKSENLNE
jgi:hypothetical protein